VFLFTRDPSLIPGNRGGCTSDDFIQFVNHFLRYRSIPGPPLTPQDLVSYLVSQGVEVGIMPQGVGIAGFDAWAVQNLRFDAGWVRAVSTSRLFETGSAYHLRRFTKFQTGRFPRFKRLRSRPRTSTTCSVSVLRKRAGRSTQVHWS
jgi:hypothetical protein